MNNLLMIDAAIKLALGVLLVLFPGVSFASLGLPAPDQPFYAGLLGGVLFGIGIGLLQERFRPAGRSAGVGLRGAIVINLCAGQVLLLWLLSGRLELPPVGSVVLWIMVVVLFGISLLEGVSLLHVRSD